jgi:glycosyltransferase involved in cell wall biosynthesis
MDGVDISKEDLGKYDVVHFTRFNPFIVSVPFSKPKKTKFVLTIYDLIPLIYPDHYLLGVKGLIKLAINKYLIRRNVDAIITISETSKKDICRFFAIDPKLVHVIYLAPRSVFHPISNRQSLIKMQKKYNLPKSFALYVGDINYNKNVPNLVKACKIAKMPLVIAGKQVKEVESLNLNHPELKHLKNIDWSEILRLGFVPDSDLVAIYNLAAVYVQPSLYEGFGLPVLEAVACNTPIVATKTQALVEILGDGLNYVDPSDPKEIAMSILNPNKNVKLPRIYSWEKMAKETFKVYEDV